MKQKYLILAILVLLGAGMFLVTAKPGQAEAISNWTSNMHSYSSSNVSNQSSVSINQSYQQTFGREYKMDYSSINGRVTWSYQAREPGGDWETISSGSSGDSADTPSFGQPSMEQMMEDMHHNMMDQMPQAMNMTGMMVGMAM